jgi:iron(III) transport system permease protein
MKHLLDFWNLILLGIVALIAIFLLWPLSQVLHLSFLDADTGEWTLKHYLKILSHRYYLTAVTNSLLVGVLGMLGACLLGIPLAYFMSRYRVRWRPFISTLAILALVSPPFIGAYAWIMLLGANGSLTNFLRSLGLDPPLIYGLPGIVLVFSFKYYPFVFIMTEGALSSINRSYEEAAENLGYQTWERFLRITLPLAFPAVSTSAILCFVLSIADFGTPSIIGKNFRTLSTIAYNQYTTEMGGTPSLAVTISILLTVISILVVTAQRNFMKKRRYVSGISRKIEQQKLQGSKGLMIHGFCYLVVLISMLPNLVVIHTSFLATNGPVFSGGYAMGSYERVWREIDDSVANSFLFASLAVLLIVGVSGFISYVIVRKSNVWSGTLDSMLMVPFIVPGIVMAIGFVVTFNTWPLDLVGTTLIIVLIVFIRRLPYGVRSTSATLRTIKPSVEEAAISLGVPPSHVFLKITLPLMLPGLIAGGMMSFITAINELSSTLILYTSSTMTMPVRVYLSVLDGEFGIAAALSTILLVSTAVCVFTVMKVSRSDGTSFL